jgi:GNAT superfamily N-acetyltransferase
MCDEWMARLDLPLSEEQFQRLPRNAAFRYDQRDGRVWINPRPRYYHALLDLTTPRDGARAAATVRPVRPEDWAAMAELFARSFRDHQPFAGLNDAEAAEAAQKCLAQTRNDGDGPWIEAASFLAWDAAGELSGAVLITLLPDADLTSFDGYHWAEPPPPDCLARRLGRPHLTWVFVGPNWSGCGLGARLLDAAAAALLGLGYRELASTFLVGNESSMLWHWRNGFRLLTHPGSRRKE